MKFTLSALVAIGILLAGSATVATGMADAEWSREDPIAMTAAEDAEEHRTDAVVADVRELASRIRGLAGTAEELLSRLAARHPIAPTTAAEPASGL